MKIRCEAGETHLPSVREPAACPKPKTTKCSNRLGRRVGGNCQFWRGWHCSNSFRSDSESLSPGMQIESTICDPAMMVYQENAWFAISTNTASGLCILNRMRHCFDPPYLPAHRHNFVLKCCYVPAHCVALVLRFNRSSEESSCDSLLAEGNAAWMKVVHLVTWGSTYRTPRAPALCHIMQCIIALANDY